MRRKKTFLYRDMSNIKYIKGKGEGKVASVLFFNRAPRHESVLGELKYSSTYS